MKTVTLTLTIVITTTSLFSAEKDVLPKVAWYGTLKQGLVEAERSKRPILLVSGAPQCLGVSGIW